MTMACSAQAKGVGRGLQERVEPREAARAACPCSVVLSLFPQNKPKVLQELRP